jgi:hypothetical protein
MKQMFREPQQARFGWREAPAASRAQMPQAERGTSGAFIRAIGFD